MYSFLLYLETSSKNCSVAISKNDKLLCSCEESSLDQFPHDKNLHTFIEYVLEGAEISVNHLNGICIGKGPGSYTGLRIGTATAKGLCYALNLPLIALNSLEILTQKYINDNSYDLIIPMMKAWKMKVYTAIFDSHGNNLIPSYILTIDENLLQKYRKRKILIIGDAARKVENFIQEQSLLFSSIEFITESPSSKEMLTIGWKSFINKKFESLICFEPFYMKDFISYKKSI